MAELRCPMCGKANPDTLEVCQFCGARLRPLVLPMTGELSLPEDWIKTPPASEPPAAPAQPAQAADDWLGSLRSGAAQNDETDSFDSPVAANPVDDWLAKLRAQDEAEDAEAEAESAPPPQGLPASNWLNNPGSTEETFVHRPQPKQEDPSLPAWLSASDDEPAPTFGQPAAQAEPEPGLPDWLSGSSSAESDAPALPDWMNGSPDDTFAAPPPTASALPDWMNGSPDDTFAAPPPTAPAPKEELPSWLSSAASEPDNDSSNLPDWMRTEPEPEQPAASSSSLPDWLSSSSASTDETFVKPPKAQTPASDLPDWLSSSGSPDDTISIEPPAAPYQPDRTQPMPQESELPDWLAGSQPTTPDWLSAASAAGAASDDTISLSDAGYPTNRGTSDSAPDQPATQPDLPDWLSGPAETPAPAQAPADKPGSTPLPASAPLPDWLSETISRSPSGTLRQSPAQPATPELPDWLTSGIDEAPATSQPSALAAPPPAQPEGRAVEGLTDWLSGDSAAEMPGSAKPVTNASEAAPAEPGAGRPLTTTGWLRSLSSAEMDSDSLDWLSTPPSTAPGAPATPASGAPAKSDKALVGSTDWLANNPDAGPAPAGAELPDWLSAPPSAPPPAAPSTPAKNDKALVGSTDWLANESSGPKLDEIPDWLSGATPPPSAPAAPPPAAPSAPARNDKAVVGSTDWLANQDAGSTPVDIPDWLTLTTTQPSAPAAPPSQPPAQKDKAVVGSTDWFASTEGGAAPSNDIPDWLKGPEPAAAEPPQPSGSVFGTTDWLNSLGSGPVTGALEPPSASPAKKAKTGWLTGPLKAPAAADQPSAPAPASKAVLGATDWLDSLAAAAPTSGTGPLDKPAAPINTELPDWLGGTAASPSGTSELPDWVSGAPAPAEAAPAPAPIPDSSGKAVVGTTDWLKSLTTQPDKGAAPPAFVDTGMLSDIRKNDVSDLDWLNALQPASPSAAPSAQRPLGTGPLKARRQTGQLHPPEAEAEPASGDLPAWLAAIRPTGIELPVSSTMETETHMVSHVPSTPTASIASSEADLPDWMKQAPAAQPNAPAAPTPRGQPAAPFSTEDTLVSAHHLPGLTAAQSAPPVPAFSTPISPEADDVVTANLPGWMRALRPLDARATAREPEPDHEETAGPLAGMRGMLPAESVITMAGRPGASVMGFVLSDADTRRAERLRRLVQEEGTEEIDVKPHKRRGINFDVWRLVVALVLFALAFLPFFQSIVPADMQAQVFAPPPVSAGVESFAKTVDTIQAQQVAVVAVEYEPASRGELDPAVEAVLVHLLEKHARVALVSSSPTGAGVAQDVLELALTEVRGQPGSPVLVAGKDFINLGFVPGGAAGLRQFALSPLAAFQTDFSGNAISASDWADLTSLEKTKLVVVASGSSDGIQNWLQQVQPQLVKSPPFTAISSASAEPLVSPYAGGTAPQLAGLVSGLSGAIQYDKVTGRTSPDAAQVAARWFSFGLGLYAIAGVLTLGSLISITLLVVRRRPAKAKAATRTRPVAGATRAAAPAPEPVSEPAPMPEEETQDQVLSGAWDPSAEETLVATPKAKPKAATKATSKTNGAKPAKGAPTKKAPASKTTAAKGKTTTAAGQAKPKSKSLETRVETETAARAKPRMRKV